MLSVLRRARKSLGQIALSLAAVALAARGNDLTDAAVAELGFLQTPKNTGFAFAGDAVYNQELLGEGIAIGLRKNEPQLMEAINRALAEMHKNGTYDTIQKKYFTFDIYN